MMRLTPSDLIAYYRPKECELRVWLRARGEREEAASEYDQVLRRLGQRHERQHLATLGECVALDTGTEEERVRRTLEAVRAGRGVVYQAALRTTRRMGGAEVEIFGSPDFLIRADGGYAIRDAKMARRIDEANHPEILMQLQVYGWLFEQNFGRGPVALEICNGKAELVRVGYDGAAGALEMLDRIFEIERSAEEPYEPVGWSKCKECGYKSRCWNAAEARGDVAVVRGVDQSMARALRDAGVRTRRDLIERFDARELSEFKRPVGKQLRRVGQGAERILQCAMAMESGQERVLALPAITAAANYAIFDLEGMPPHLDDLGKIYLWGVQVFGERPGDFMPAVAGFGADGDRAGWMDFLANAARIFEEYGENIRFVHWADYEATHVKEYIERYGDGGGVGGRVLAVLLDLRRIAEKCVELPLPSYSLKVVEQYVKYARKQEDFGGRWAMAKFIEATEASDEAERARLIDQIVEYNREDLEATWAVFEWLRARKPA
ncbi:MAG: TM0106 family RecB-like putative nuclease [Candidatus Acidiferrales bacterium]